MSRISAVTRAALIAASLQLGGPAAMKVSNSPEVNLADALAGRITRSRFARMLIGATRQHDTSGMYSNGGQRRKRALRARRMNNAGHGNRWSKRHA